jgi:photosystem II stability/assembly factor-like uncharacterized protein
MMQASTVITRRHALLLCMAAGTALAIGAAQQTGSVALPEPLDTPAVPSDFAKKGMASGIARQGNSLVAVGPRGLILVSSDGSATWKQVASPVSTDLASVKFTDATTVWAVGHDAVALRSTDAGMSWQKMLDGRSVYTLMRDHYEQQAKSGNEAGTQMLAEVQRSVAGSASKNVLPAPFLDVWFANANEGYLVGAFGLILHTTDGGKQWQPWVERLDNERRFHLYAVTGDGAQAWISGEQGLLLRLDAKTGRFAKVATPYNGTFFGVQLHGARVTAFGLRGNVYSRESDAAAWNKIETGVDANIVAALELEPASGHRQLVLVSQAGHVLAVSADGRKAVDLKVPGMGEVVGAVASGPQQIAFARVNGVGSLQLSKLTP